MWSLIAGFVGGIVAWIMITVVAQPLQKFLQLRQQAAILLVRYDGQAWIGNPEAKSTTNEWLEERRAALDQVGSELVAFADANTFIARMLHHRGLGRYRCDVRYAGEDLRSLAAAYPGTQVWDQLRAVVMSRLKIAGWPRDVVGRRWKRKERRP
jgi:hypothetical protein